MLKLCNIYYYYYYYYMFRVEATTLHNESNAKLPQKRNDTAVEKGDFIFFFIRSKFP